MPPPSCALIPERGLACSHIEGECPPANKRVGGRLRSVSARDQRSACGGTWELSWLPPYNKMPSRSKWGRPKIVQLHLAAPARGPVLGDTLDDRAGRIALAERFPGESKKSLASGGITCSNISDVGEHDADRISKLDVSRPLVGRRISKGEYNGIASGKRFCARHREDCVADSTSLNLRYPLFASGVAVHLRLRSMNGGQINFSLMTPNTDDH